MTALSGIPAHLLRAAADLPENRASAEALRRAAGLSETLPILLYSQGVEGAQGGTEARSGGTRERPGEFRCPIDPVGKPRQTRSDRWKERPAVVRYRAFADELRAWADANHFRFPESGCHVRFEMPMPRTWSKAKRAAMDGQPHQQKPDLDNCIKATWDALLADDCRVWQVSAGKRWARSGAVVFLISA